ncbi:hypothetical protein ACFX2F_019549 [Malus domestica]
MVSMVSSFSNPGFSPVHTHPPHFFAMVAMSKTSIRETVDAVFAPFLAKICREFALLHRELALSVVGDSTSTLMFAISE